MFSIFGSKKIFLKDLTPGFTDIHAHLLFGIDDGAKESEDTRSLLEAFIDLGFARATATPHTYQGVWNNTYEGITSRYQEVRRLFPELTDKLQLRTASEYLMDDSFVQRFQSEKLLTIKDNYVLVEMSYLNAPIQLYEILFDLQVAGYKPVLAHPERYLFFHQQMDQYKKLKQSGCFFQMNLLSSIGYYGENVAKVADMLLKMGLIDFAGSDVHHLHHIQGFEKNIRIKNIQALKQVIANNSFFG